MRILLPALVLASACKKDEIVWVPFNADGEFFDVHVGPDEVGSEAVITLLSNLEVTQIGEASIDPDAGPVGTEHTIIVEIFEEFEDMVGRCSVTVDSQAVSDLDGDGENEARDNRPFEMRRDAADPGIFAVTLLSLGEDDEVRTDRVTVHVWTPDQLVEQPGTTE